LIAAHADRASSAGATWHGTATGVQDRARHHDEQTDPNVVWDDSQHYRVVFSFSFSIGSGGSISGTGTGHYTASQWHIAGINEHAANDNPPKDPHFDCMPPIRGNTFKVQVSGSATSSKVTLRLAIPAASEVGDDYDCGADFTGFASTTHYMAQSLQDAGGGSLSFSRSHPSVPTLTHDLTIDTGKTTGNAHTTWTIRVVPPAGGNNGGGGGGGGSTTPSGNPPNRSLCTITGTARSEVLAGTQGHDVICAYGGNDVIRGRGGADSIYAGSGKDTITPGSGADVVSAGPGADRISARDGKRDRVDGGSGSDRATIDRGRDRVTHIERTS
jgi:Ca2+-binding RTX toxin-like protein